MGGLQLYSEGQGAKSCVVKCTRVPNQLSPHLPMDGVSTAWPSTCPCRRYNPAEKGLENLNHLLIQVCTRVHMLCTFVIFLYSTCTLCTQCTLRVHCVRKPFFSQICRFFLKFYRNFLKLFDCSVAVLIVPMFSPAFCGPRGPMAGRCPPHVSETESCT